MNAFPALTFLKLTNALESRCLPSPQGRSPPVTETLRCSFSGCERPGAASLARRPFCREHFIITCYAELEASSEQMREQGFDDRAAESVRHFVHECVEQATALARKETYLSNLERARLIDILLWAARVGRRLRRSPRKVATVPIRFRSERPGRPWEEETETRVVSRYGALVECEHPAKTGETLRILRLDKALEADARVAWHQPKKGGRQEMGLEFLNCDNFWELDWGAAEPAHSP